MELYKLKKKKRFMIKQLPKCPLLQSLGVFVGLSTVVKSKMPFGGPIIITVGKREIALGKEIAEEIMVEEVG